MIKNQIKTKQSGNVQVDSYERYIRDSEAREAAGEVINDGLTVEQRRKDRMECLELLKSELRRIRDGGDPFNFDHMLSDEEKQMFEMCDEKDDDEDNDGEKKEETEDDNKDKNEIKEEEENVEKIEDKELKKDK